MGRAWSSMPIVTLDTLNEWARAGEWDALKTWASTNDFSITFSINFSIANLMLKTSIAREKEEGFPSPSSSLPPPALTNVYTNPPLLLPTLFPSEEEKENFRPFSQSVRSKITDSPEFIAFWQAYPRKIGKGYARRCFKAALGKASFGTIMQGLEAQLPAMRRQEPDWVPYPSTWLNGEHWTNEPDVIPMVPSHAPFKPPTDDEISALEQLADFGGE